MAKSCESRNWDHPRLRGEKPGTSFSDASDRGSPPLTRGKDIRTHCLYPPFRITPAYAGKSDNLCCNSNERRDHPRLRGEKFLYTHTANHKEGSPPLTRGKVDIKQVGQAALGITPAYAGKSGDKPPSRRKLWDHPRLRGEKLIAVYRYKRKEGSPPLTRGKGIA